MEQIKEILLSKYTLIALAVLLVVLIILFITRSAQKKKYKKELEAFQVRYNKIKSIPLNHKLNKMASVVPEDKLSETSKFYTEDLEQIQNNFKVITRMLGSMEDNIIVGNMKELKTIKIDLDGLLNSAEKHVKKLDASLSKALEPETKQRDEINTLKERFRAIKQLYSEKSGSYTIATELIDGKISELENLFTRFEEQMAVNQFENARESSDDIQKSIEYIENLLEKLPDLISEANGVLPVLIQNVEEQNSQMIQKGIVLTHLDVDKNINIIKESLNQDINDLRNGNFDKAVEHFVDYKTRLNQISEQIEKENSAFDDVPNTLNSCTEKIEGINKTIEDIENLYSEIGERYSFEYIKNDIPNMKNDYENILKLESSLKEMISTNRVPSSTVLLSLKELKTSVYVLGEKVNEYFNSLNDISKAEKRANKQLLKLHLIMNEIKVKINCYHIPTVSEQCSDDIKEAYSKISNLESLLDQQTMESKELNNTLADTIDFVYKLYNNVNNIVGMAQMCENTIVFANKYRSELPDLDSALTRSELLFKNGEYTEALTIAVNAVEKLHLDSYETLIKENACSAQ